MVPLPNVSAVQVPRNECESGLKIQGVRYQYGTGMQECNTSGCDNCTEKQEVAFVCKTDCSYVNGSDVMPVENAASVKVPRNQCVSGRTIPAQQYLVADGGYECNETQCKQCENKWKSYHICKYDGE